jgi:protein arginine phosphatase
MASAALSGAVTDDTDPLDVVVVCTGNAARSVMAGVMLEELAATDGRSLALTTAGTHAMEGLPPSWRTREALARLSGLDAHAWVSRHRSRQLAGGHVERADLVVGMEADHVRFVRAMWPEAAIRTATLRRLCRDLSAGDRPLPARLAELRLDKVELEAWEDVTDPAGGELERYSACAEELWALVRQLWPRLCA